MRSKICQGLMAGKLCRCAELFAGTMPLMEATCTIFLTCHLKEGEL